MLPARWRDRSRLGVLALVAFVLAHDLIFLARYGSSYGVVLARTGHGDQWTATVVVVALLAAILVAATIARSVALVRLARRLGADRMDVREGDLGGLVRRIVRAWVVILPIALAAFVFAENVEHALVGLPIPGIGVLDDRAYGDTLLVFLVVTGLVALVEGLFRWRRDLLVERIREVRARWAHAHLATRRPDLPYVERQHGSLVGRRMAGRAPPSALPA